MPVIDLISSSCRGYIKVSVRQQNIHSGEKPQDLVKLNKL